MVDRAVGLRQDPDASNRTIVILRINYKLLIYRLALMNRIPSYLPLSDKKSIYGETALLLRLQRWNFPCKLFSFMHIFGIHYPLFALPSMHCISIYYFPYGQSVFFLLLAFLFLEEPY